MKRKVVIIVPIIVFVFALAFIFFPKEETSKKAGQNFLEQYYSFSKEDNVMRESVSDNEALAEKLQEDYQETAWSECIDLLTKNRYYDQIQEIYLQEKTNLVFKEAKLVLMEKGETDKNSAHYNYECTFKGTDNSYTAKGQLSVEKQNGIWKVKRFTPSSMQKKQ